MVERVVRYILVNHRWVFVCFLLPVMVVYKMYDTFLYLAQKLRSDQKYMVQQHAVRVNDVQLQVQHLQKCKKSLMCTGRPSWRCMTPRDMVYKNYLSKVDMKLSDILEIRVDTESVRVEPGVTMGQLTSFLIPRGWTIPVVIELDDITVGGVVMGAGLETSSHKYGLFHEICISYEIVTGDGDTVTCSEEENPDLFYAIPCSFGTIGFLVSVEIRIIPALKYVKLEYQPLYNTDEITLLQEQCKNLENDFLECIMFDSSKGVLMKGRLTNDATNCIVNRIGLWHKPWFFEHVKKFLTSGPGTECIPLRDYYHRHTRSLFWELQDIVPFGNNFLFRVLGGWLMPPKVSLLKLTQTSVVKQMYLENHIIQDLFIPFDKLERFIYFLDEHIKVYPLWICPLKIFDKNGFFKLKSDIPKLYADVGIYGEPKVKPFEYKTVTRLLQTYVLSQNGYQMLYAGTYLDVEEFRQMFNHDLYNKVKKRYESCGAFPELYDKVKSSARI